MENFKNFKLNKIYHIVLDTSQFENSQYQLKLDEIEKATNSLISIHLIDREHNVEINILTYYPLITSKTLYYQDGDGNTYYFRYNESRNMFIKEWVSI